MATIFETQLPRASFDGIEFPIKSLEVTGGLRSHTHEYPHSPGGAPEKLGRKLYIIRMNGIFDAKLVRYGENLWPGDLADLRDRFEDQTTAELVIPTIGPIQAFATSWTQRAMPEMQSGEEMDMEFLEDQSQAFLFEGLINITFSSLQSSGDAFTSDFQDLLNGGVITSTGTVVPTLAEGQAIPRATTVSAAYTQLRQTDADLLTNIQNNYTQAVGYADTPDRFAGRILDKAQATIYQCQLARERVEVLKNPLAWKQLDTLKRVWASAQDLAESVNGRDNRILFYTTRRDMSIHEVARDIYGDTSYGTSILQLNAIENPFRILKGTVLRYYDPSTFGSQAA